MDYFDTILLKRPEKIRLSNDAINLAIKDVNRKMVNLDSVKFNINDYTGFKRIVVIGNQRSGTTFTAKYLAKALNFKYVDEHAILLNDIPKLQKAFTDNVVVQAPAMSLYIHKLATSDDLVVFMVRDWSDILISVQKKNGYLSDWIYMKSVYIYHLAKWMSFDPASADVFLKHVDMDSYSFDSLYKMWKYYQQDRIANTINLLYDSLSITGEWVSKKDRTKFGAKDTGELLKFS